MGLLTDMVLGTAAVIASPVWGIRMLQTGKHRTDWPGRFGKGESLPAKAADSRGRILIHAVSVGEINAITKLVEALEKSGNVEVIIAATTDTGLARAEQLYGSHHPILRYPFDFSWAVKRLLDRVQPDLVVTVELELWPNLMQECEHRGIPVAVVNGRLSERSFRGYSRIRALIRPMFQKVTWVGAQSRAIADRFIAMGTPAERVEVLGTMKWDATPVEEKVAGADDLTQALGIDRSQPVVVAGSTGPGEESALIEQIERDCPAGTQLVLVPRKPERFDEVAMLRPGMVRRSQCSVQDATADESSVALSASSASKPESSRFYLLDTMGELKKAYALADVCFVGRSLLGLYGSNPIEPAALGKPVLIGPHYSDFTDVVDTLQQSGGLIVTEAVGQVVNQLLEDDARRATMGQAARQAVLNQQGVSSTTARKLLAILGQVKSSH